MGRNSRTKKDRRSGRPDARLPGPKRRLSRTFATLKDAAAAGDAVLVQQLTSDDPLVRFDRGILLRAVNALKSARLLLEAVHWEFAAAPARQLFELVVNVEHLNAQDDREQAAFRFAKFGLLQAIQAELATADYNRQTGRPVNERRIAVLQRMLEVDYHEFRVGIKGKFARSWSGKTTRDLALASPGQPLRKAQYLQLFVAWSEQLHAAPAALLEGFFPREWKTVEEFVREDDLRIAETGAMCVTLFVDLWTRLLNLPALDIQRATHWQSALIAEARSLGAPDPR